MLGIQKRAKVEFSSLKLHVTAVIFEDREADEIAHPKDN